MTDDIIQILDMTSMHITDPLRSKIQDACIEARLSGNVAGALRNLSLKVSHEKLNEALANDEIDYVHGATFTTNAIKAHVATIVGAHTSAYGN